MFSTKYCSIFSWNSGSMKVASARDLVKETIKCQSWWWMMIFSWWWFLYDAAPHLWVGHEEREHGRDVGHQTLEQGQGHCQEQGPRADLGHCHYRHVTTIKISINKNWATSHNYHVLKMINRSILDSLPSHSSSIKSQWIHQAFRQKWFHCWFWFLVFG